MKISESKPNILFILIAVHTPIEAPKDLVEKYRLKSKKLKLDKINSSSLGGFCPTEQMKQLQANHRLVQSNHFYAAMIENLDWNVGRVLQALDETEQKKNTIVVFTSDNGGFSVCAGKGNPATSNLPLQAGKGWMFDGGTRVPFIIRWPKHVQPQKICTHPIISPDIYPMLLESAGLDICSEQKIDGISFLSLLDGDNNFERGPIFWHYPHYGNCAGAPFCAVRYKKWKLIEFYEDGNIELYDLEKDISEINNIAEQNSEIVIKLQSLLTTWRRNVNAIKPVRNTKWN